MKITGQVYNDFRIVRDQNSRQHGKTYHLEWVGDPGRKPARADDAEAIGSEEEVVVGAEKDPADFSSFPMES